MRYSYIEPRKKTPLTPEVQLIFSFFGMTILLLVLTYAFLLYKDYTFVEESKKMQQEEQYLKEEIAKMKAKIVYIKKQNLVAEKIHTQNMVLKDSITNLFDLVPQRITLSKAVLMEKGLILHGVTPSKDVYNFMLEAPLRSIFQKTYSSFYPAKNGWFYFVSKNYMDDTSDEELSIEN